MKVLLVHNYYQQPGGEDQVLASEAELLRAFGHEVVRFTMHNDVIEGMTRLTVARATVWNRDAHAALSDVVRRERPAVAHFHNTFPLISPAAYYAARAGGAAVVQTLHNYRLLCPAHTFLRDGRVCEDCLGKTVPWPSVMHACYRGSRAASATVAAMLTVHRLAGTWQHAVDRYIALTEFSREKFVQGGLPADRIVVKPNFIDFDPGVGAGNGDATGRYALFVGRLSQEKGIDTLLQAWQRLPIANKPILKIVGDGPLAGEVKCAAERDRAIQWLGRRAPAEVYPLVAAAAFLVLPSIWYEGQPRVLLEAFATGTPALASRLGSMPEVVSDGRTGLLFRAGDAEDLAQKVVEMLSDGARLQCMRRDARAAFERDYTASRNGPMINAIYASAVASSAKKHPRVERNR